MSKVNVFITGSTGYIGGAVLGRLLAHTESANFSFTILVRDAAKGERFKSSMVIPALERKIIGPDVICYNYSE